MHPKAGVGHARRRGDAAAAIGRLEPVYDRTAGPELSVAYAAALRGSGKTIDARKVLEPLAAREGYTFVADGANGVPDYFDRRRDVTALEETALFREAGVTLTGPAGQDVDGHTGSGRSVVDRAGGSSRSYWHT